MKKIGWMGMLAVAATIPVAAHAQIRRDEVRPPAGLCQIWIDGVAPNRQPRPMNCEAAGARVPRNGHIIYGDRIPLPDRGVYNSTERIGTLYGQNCVERTNKYGQVQSVCNNAGGTRNDEAYIARERQQQEYERAQQIAAERQHAEWERARAIAAARQHEEYERVRAADRSHAADRDHAHDRNHDHDQNHDHGR